MKNVIAIITAISIAFSSNLATANRHFDADQSERREQKEHRYSDKHRRDSHKSHGHKHDKHARAHSKDGHHNRVAQNKHQKNNVHKKHHRQHHHAKNKYHHSKTHKHNHHVNHHAHNKLHHAKKYRHSHHKNRHDKVGYILGGMVIGAVANEILSASNDHSSSRVTTYTSSEPVTYLRDEYGSCYFVADKPQGRVLTEVSSVFCSAN